MTPLPAKLPQKGSGSAAGFNCDFIIVYMFRKGRAF